MNASRLRVVTIDNFYQCIEIPLVRQLFGELIRLRSQGYGPEYSESFLPLDSADFICRHHFLCLKTDSALVPIGGCRQIFLDSCDFYDMELPILKLIRGGTDKDAIAAVNDLIQQARLQKRRLVYGSGITIRKDWRANSEFSEIFRKFIAAVVVEDCKDPKVEASICAAAMKFKVHLWLEKMGFEALTHKGARLGVLPNALVGGEPLLLMKMLTPSNWARNCHESLADLFERKILIAPDRHPAENHRAGPRGIAPASGLKPPN